MSGYRTVVVGSDGSQTSFVAEDRAADRKADLLVIGNRGPNAIAGRILGSVPLDIVRHAGTDVLIVHTT